jgi:hypothetical protein
LKAQTACYQDIDDVLDLTYLPSTAEDIVLFEEKQKYMYSVQASRRKKSSLINQGGHQGANGGIIGGITGILTQGSLNAILIKRLIFVTWMTMRSPLPFILSLLELLCDLNGRMSFL